MRELPGSSLKTAWFFEMRWSAMDLCRLIVSGGILPWKMSRILTHTLNFRYLRIIWDDKFAMTGAAMKAGLNSNWIKLIAIIAMTIDHIAWLVFPGYPREIAPVAMHIVGRITCPIMCYFIAEGYHYTKDITKYTQRLFVFAIISHFSYVFFSANFIDIHNQFLLFRYRITQKNNNLYSFVCYVLALFGYWLLKVFLL